MTDARPGGQERAPEETLDLSLDIDSRESTPETAPDQDPDEGHDFDWSTDSNDIVLREQPATAIYRNPYGFIVIRQENRDRGNWDDDVVLIDPAHAELFILALQQAAGLDR